MLSGILEYEEGFVDWLETQEYQISNMEGKPDMLTRHNVNICDTVPTMLQSDLDVEYAVADALKNTIAICEKEKDFATRDMLIVLLDDTEMDHAHWLEQQLGLISKIGLENYLQSQM